MWLVVIVVVASSSWEEGVHRRGSVGDVADTSKEEGLTVALCALNPM